MKSAQISLHYVSIKKYSIFLIIMQIPGFAWTK